MKTLAIMAAVLLTASVFGATVVDNGAAGTSSTGTWTSVSGAGSYGAVGVSSNVKDSTYTFSAPATGVTIVSLWWTAAGNRCGSVPVTVWNGTTQVGTVTLDQRIAGERWVPIGTYNFGGSARVVLTATAGSYTIADGLMLESGAEALLVEDPPVPLPISKFVAGWIPVTKNIDGSACSPTGYELWATPATVDLYATPANDAGAVKRVVPPTPTTDVDVTAMIVSTARFTWRLWVRTLAGDKFSDWSNPVAVIYDPTLSDPIILVVPAAPALSGTVRR